MIDGQSRSQVFDSYDAAVDWRLRQMDRRRKGLGADPTAPRTRVDQWWEQWRAGAIRRPNTLARYDSLWRSHLEARWGRRQIGSITRLDAQAWVGEMAQAGLASASVRKAVYLMGTLLQAACRSGVIERNSFRDLELPEADDEERRFVTPAEAHGIAEHMEPWWRPIVPFGMDTGLRLSEFGGLVVRDLDLMRRTIHVRRIVTEPHGKVVVGPPKTKAGVRVVPTLTIEVAELLAAHISDRGLGPDDYVFAGPRGGLMAPHNWRTRVWQPAVASARLDEPNPTPHALRHGAVAAWIAAGLTDAYKLAKYLGHRDPASVHRMYGHLLPEDSSKLTEQLSAIRAASRPSADEAPIEMDRYRRPS